VTGGRPKHLVEVGGRTLLERHMEMAERIGLEPVVVTRREFVADFQATGVQVVVEEDPRELKDTLSNVRRHAPYETYSWIGGDMVLTDFAPVRDLVQAHRAEQPAGSFLYSRSQRFKAKLSLSPRPELALTRQPGYPFSVLNFGIHEPRLFAYLPGDLRSPLDNFVQNAMRGGERFLFQPYEAAAFEIDTPADLEEARRHYEGFAQAC
jgi:NDP-sugar pyrophosphorylase family protein